MPLVLVLAAATTMASVPLAWWAVSGARRAPVRCHRWAGAGGVTDLRQAVLAHSARERALRPVVQLLAEKARRLTPGGVVESLERRVLLAGAPPAWRIERVLAAKLVLGGGGLALGVTRFLASGGMVGLLIAAALPVLGYVGPDMGLRNLATKRQGRISQQMPDTLDQITISVEAGLGFDAAMARSARTGKGPLAEELLRTLQDVQAGMSRNQALKRLVTRTDVAELRHFVLALVQADSYGVPIAQVLRVQSAELRVKRRQKAEEKAMKIPVKVLFPLMVCILPCMFIVIIGPAAMRIMHNFKGF